MCDISWVVNNFAPVHLCMHMSYIINCLIAAMQTYTGLWYVAMCTMWDEKIRCLCIRDNNFFKPGTRWPAAGAHLVSYNHFHSTKVCMCVYACVRPRGHKLLVT